MKRKLLPLLLVVLVVLIAAVVFFVPRSVNLSGFYAVRCNANGAARALGRQASWDSILSSGRVAGYGVRISRNGFHAVGVAIWKGGDTVRSTISILPIGTVDSTVLQWNSEMAGGQSGFGRVGQYLSARNMKVVIDSLQVRVKDWLEHTEHLYGIEMRDSMSKTTRILLIRGLTPEYPTVADIYGRVSVIRAYMKKLGMQEIDHPMLNVSEKTDSGYASIVGVQMDGDVLGAGVIESKRYVPWKIMMGRVVGGPAQCEQGMKDLQQYVSDHQKPAMGLPFQSMVTERDQEADSGKWVTWVVQAIP